VDYEKRRIFRDSFWKGSFAEDTLLGWEERVRTTALGGGAEKTGAAFAGGSFWKRFDRLENGVAAGHVVNYELAWLPGKPEVRQVEYPNDGRRYFKKGDPVLLLQYTNDPYRIVYDTIKVIDDNNAIGVMHLGAFPDGIEFATFVMARNNYPFEKMSVEDHHVIFSDPRAGVPAGAQLEGEWEGSLIFLAQPNLSLLNQVNPVLFRLALKNVGGQVEARCRLGVMSDFVRVADPAAFGHDTRLIDQETMIGRWVMSDLSPLELGGLRDYAEPYSDRLVLYYVLKRTRAGAAIV